MMHFRPAALVGVISYFVISSIVEAQEFRPTADVPNKCSTLEIPDAPLRLFRRPDGSIVAFASHYQNWAMTGQSFDRLTKNCAIIYEGTLDPDPSHFDYKTWIAATWLSDDGSVVALGHNEYQAHELPGRCAFEDYTSCWYNSIVLLKSDDLGQTFYRGDSPRQAVVAPDFVDMVGQGHPRGFTSPTNLVGWGNYLYTLVGYSGAEKGDQGRCVLRTRLPVTSTSWEILTAEGYVRPNSNPFVNNLKVRCMYVQGVRGFVGSIAKLKNSDFFVATVAEDGNDAGNIVIYFSEDLVHWHDRQVLERLSLFWSKNCIADERFSYPSLIDETSISPNFDTVGNTAELYLVRAPCRVGLERTLVKTAVKIVPPIHRHE